MLGLIASLLSQTVLCIAYTKLHAGNVEIVKYTGEGAGTVIFERKLPVSTESDNLAAVHNNMLSASMALAYHKKLSHLLTLQITKTIHTGDTFESYADLIEITSSGKVVHSQKITFEYGETVYFGWDDRDVAIAIKTAIGHDFFIWKVNKWQQADIQDMPLNFISYLSPEGTPKCRFIGRLMGTNRWGDTSFPTISVFSNAVLGCANCEIGASAIYDAASVRAVWDGQAVERKFAEGIPLNFVRILNYPNVVGRYCSNYRAVLPSYSKWNIGPTDPFRHSEIWIFNLLTGKVKKVGEGVYAIPLN